MLLVADKSAALMSDSSWFTNGFCPTPIGEKLWQSLATL